MSHEDCLPSKEGNRSVLHASRLLNMFSNHPVLHASRLPLTNGNQSVLPIHASRLHNVLCNRSVLLTHEGRLVTNVTNQTLAKVQNLIFAPIPFLRPKRTSRQQVLHLFGLTQEWLYTT